MFAPDNRQQPLPRRLHVAQIIHRPPGTQQRLLHHVLGNRAVTAQPERETEQVRAQCRAQLIEPSLSLLSVARTIHV